MAKAKQTKVKEISQDTKERVLERQHHRSISGVALSDPTFHHCVSRGQGGVGYEWNIVALTFDEHRALHDGQPIKVNGRERYTNDEFITLIHNHLALRYDGWSRDKCKYHKYWDEEDYGVKRCGRKL